MLIEKYYNELWTDAISNFKAGAFEYDPLIIDKTDKRFGLTLLLRPSLEVKQSIEDLLANLRRIEPDQYYYPASDLHVTILSIVSCYNGFTKASFVAENYIQVIKASLKNIQPFDMHFMGITASPSCVMVQGFPGGMLNLFRKNLRKQFAQSFLEKSFDSRYTIKLAHATVMRFQDKLKSPKHFIREIEKYRHCKFGVSHVENIELVYNDWYQRQQHCELLATFKLGPGIV